MRALRFAAAGAFALVEAAVALALIFTNDRHDPDWLVAAFALAAGLSFVTAGLVALWRRPDNRTGLLLAATGYLWFLGALSESNHELVYTVGFVAGNSAFVLFVALVLAYPDGRLAPLDRWLVAAAAVIAVGANVAGALLDDDPDKSCPECPHSAIAVADLPGAKGAVYTAATIAAVAALSLIAAILVRRWRRASPAQRRVLRPVAMSCGLSLGLLIVALVADRIDSTGYSVVWILFLVSFVAVPLSFLGGVLRSRLARTSVTDLLLALDSGTPMREALARALHDPSLEIVYWLGTSNRWVDETGRGVERPTASPTRAVRMVERGGHDVAALVHDPAVDEDPQVVASVAAAAGVFLQNERLQAELRAQYEFLHTIVDTAPSLLVVLAPDARIVDLNLAAERASGVSDPAGIMGRLFWDVFIDPDERDAVKERFAAAAPEHPGGEYENVFTNANGERIAIAWRSAPVVAEDGTVTSIVAGGIDVTVRKRRELELQRERDATTTVIQSIPSLIVVLDQAGVIVDRDVGNPLAAVNRAFHETLRWRDLDIVGRELVELVHADDREPARAAIAAAAEGVPSAELESRWQRADGSYVEIEWSATPVTDTTGRRSKLILVSGVDITERMTRQLEIRRQRDFANTIRNTIPSYLIAIGHDGMIVEDGVNRAFVRRFGWRADELADRSFLGVVAPADDRAARVAIANAANGVAHPELESRWLCRDGTARIVAWTAIPLADQRGRELVIVSGADVTERKEQEQEIRASRTRIIQAGDDARRQLERNLHDGAQQRLVSLSVSLRLAETRLDTDPAGAGEILDGARDELAAALGDLRELARGIHPAILTDRGLGAAVEALVTRTPFRVDVEVPSERLEPAVEAAAYYVVAEALTNVAKYARASSARVRVGETPADSIFVEVVDDGVGGADPALGTGLRGLADRVAALEGTLVVDGPSDGGTRVRAEIPIRRAGLVLADADRRRLEARTGPSASARS